MKEITRVLCPKTTGRVYWLWSNAFSGEWCVNLGGGRGAGLKQEVRRPLSGQQMRMFWITVVAVEREVVILEI